MNITAHYRFSPTHVPGYLLLLITQALNVARIALHGDDGGADRAKDLGGMMQNPYDTKL